MPITNKPKQSQAQRNLSILGYLVKEGTWKNLREIATGTSGPDLGRDRLKPFLDELVQLGLVEYADEPQNPQAKHEYLVTQKGRESFQKYVSFISDPTTKFVFGLSKNTSEE